jgi:hypothetical protein
MVGYHELRGDSRPRLSGRAQLENCDDYTVSDISRHRIADGGCPYGVRGQSSGAGSLGPLSGASGNREALLSKPRSWGENSLLKRSDSMIC